MILAWAPTVVACLILLGVGFYTVYRTYGFSRWKHVKIKDVYLESFIYVVMLGAVLWMLKNSGWWSSGVLKGLMK